METTTKHTTKSQLKKIIAASKNKLIKLQLDYKTIVTLKNPISLQTWLDKYPGAKVITI